jgi:hypothetical protein
MLQRFTFVRVLAAAAAAAAMVSSQGCSQAKDDAQVSSCGIQIDAFKELMIVDDSVISDGRSKNAADGPWSFRHAIEGVMPADADHSEFILSWLDNWVQTTEINGFKTDVESRVEAMNTRLVCPWLQATEANGCDTTCTTCAARELDLAKAPFKLTAIVNRTEIADRPDSASPAGESRLLFGMTDGPGDDPASKPLALSVIFEYALPDSMTPRQWVDAWHHLGTYPEFDEAFKTELAQFTERFVARNASPSRKNGSALAQMRTNESAFNWIWQMREFRLDSLGDLRLSTLQNTPGEALNNSPALESYILANADAIMADKNVLPLSMLAGSADQLRYRWGAPGVSEPLRVAFARTTCNGCHSGENPVIDTAFHVSPYRSGKEKLSQFLYNPADRSTDELSRRAATMSTKLCAAE